MNKQTTPDQPLRETEQAAWHAFREWPILLVLRQKALQAQQNTPASPFDKMKKGMSPNDP